LSVVTHAIGTHSDTVTLTSDTNPSLFGNNITLTATVAPVNPSDSTPTGVVYFRDGASASPFGSAVLVNGVATLSGVHLSAGAHSLTATYDGSLTFSVKTSAPYTQNVQVGTSTLLSSSVLNPVHGQSMTLNARVSPTSTSLITPTGTVDFILNGSIDLGSATTVNGVASLPNQVFPVGTSTITAIFTSSNILDADNELGSLNVTVGPGRGSTAVTITTGPVAHGQPVTFNIQVGTQGPGSGIPSGTVTIKDGSVLLQTLTLDETGSAQWTTSSLAINTHTFFINYLGDASTTGTLTVQKLNVVAYSTTTTVSSPQYAVAGNTITLTANVAVNGAASPTGLVAFYQGGTLLGTSSVSNGVATYVTQPLAFGTYTFSATYQGDTHCGISSTQTSSTTMMLNAPTISGVTMTPSPLPNGTVTAMVSATDPQSLPLTYTYVWNVNGTIITHSNIASPTDTLDLSAMGLVSGNTVSVKVTASNVLLNSASSSQGVTVLGPVVTNIAIGTDDPTDQNITTLTALPTTTDSPEQLISYTYQWFRNGAPIVGANGPSLNLTQLTLAQLGGTALQVRDQFTVQVAPTDTTEITGLSFTSQPATLTSISPTLSLNVPTIGSVSIIPDNNVAPTMLTANVNSSVDPLGLPITYTYQWFQNGAAISSVATPSADTANLIISQLKTYSITDTFYVVVTPSDGVLTGPAFTNTDYFTVAVS
jgi:hypothetical protein